MKNAYTGYYDMNENIYLCHKTKFENASRIALTWSELDGLDQCIIDFDFEPRDSSVAVW